MQKQGIGQEKISPPPEVTLGLYLDGIITDEEIAPLSDQTRELLTMYKERFQ